MQWWITLKSTRINQSIDHCWPWLRSIPFSPNYSEIDPLLIHFWPQLEMSNFLMLLNLYLLIQITHKYVGYRALPLWCYNINPRAQNNRSLKCKVCDNVSSMCAGLCWFKLLYVNADKPFPECFFFSFWPDEVWVPPQVSDIEGDKFPKFCLIAVCLVVEPCYKGDLKEPGRTYMYHTGWIDFLEPTKNLNVENLKERFCKDSLNQAYLNNYIR